MRALNRGGSRTRSDAGRDSANRDSMKQPLPVRDAVVVDELDAEHEAGLALRRRDPTGDAGEVVARALAFQVDGDLHLLAEREGLLGVDLQPTGGDVDGGAVILGDG